MREVVGFGMAQAAAQQVYEAAGIGPEDVDVVELHDCFAQNELLSYEALGLCPDGGAEQFVCDGDNTYGGKVVTNPSGGLLSKGHPLGATGLAQCTELVQQLRGTRRASARSKARGSRCSTTSASAAPASSRCTNASEEGTAMIDRNGSATSCPPRCCRSSAAGCSSSPRRSARPTRSTPTSPRRARPATPTCPRRRPSCSRPSSTRAPRSGCSTDLQIPIAKLLHGEQGFSYHRPACAGDTVTVRSTHQRHLRQEERRARVRRQDLARHQPARRAGRRAALGHRLPALSEAAMNAPRPSTPCRSATSCRRCSCRRSTAPRWPCSPAPRATTTRSTSTSTSRAAPACPTCSRRACWAWPGSAALLTGWAPQSRLRRFDARFQGITHLGNAMRCSGRVVEKLEHDGERCVRIEVRSANQFGQTKIAGEALVALP